MNTKNPLNKDNQNQPNHALKRTLLWTVILWAIVIVLFIIQLFWQNDWIVVAMFFIGIYGALSALVLLVVELVRHYFSKKISWMMNYIIFVVCIYGVGVLIDMMVEKDVPLLPLKIVLFVHFIIGLWLIVYWFVAVFVDRLLMLIAQRLLKSDDVDLTGVGSVLFAIVFWLVALTVQRLIDHEMIGSGIRWLFMCC